MKGYKLKRSLKRIRAHVGLVFSLPSVWLSLVILASAIASVIVARHFSRQGSEFNSSLFSNIFAGLITGLALSILSGTKAVYSAYMQERYTWLDETHIMILNFLKMHRELYSTSRMSDEEFSGKAYDTGAHANWVNERIIQSTFDRTKWIDPPKYFLKHYGYDCIRMAEELSELRESLSLIGMDDLERKEHVELFKPVVNVMFDLNCKILDDMRLIKIKIASARKSII